MEGELDLVAEGEIGGVLLGAGDTAMTVGELGAVGALPDHFDYDALGLEVVAGRHVRISGSPSVMRTVCSKWAEGLPSAVTTVQPSASWRTCARPRLTMGSMAMVMPGLSLALISRP